MRKILIDKMLKYTDILLILAKAKNEFEDGEESNMVTKQSFKDMAKNINIISQTTYIELFRTF